MPVVTRVPCHAHGIAPDDVSVATVAVAITPVGVAPVGGVAPGGAPRRSGREAFPTVLIRHVWQIVWCFLRVSLECNPTPCQSVASLVKETLPPTLKVAASALLFL